MPDIYFMQTTHKQFLVEKRKEIFTPRIRFRQAKETAARFTAVVDNVLLSILTSQLGSENDKICAAALGGYGRGELCPYSDIDLLILYSGSEIREKIRKIVTVFWDTGIQMGIAVRTLKECRSLLGEDPATDTAYLESRFLYGNRKLFSVLKNRIIRPWFFRERKRYVGLMSGLIRSGVFSEKSSMYKIEPNLKEDICALRDCQRIIWGLSVKYGGNPLDREHLLSGFRKADREKFLAGYYFLLGLRQELHMLYGRRMDVLEVSVQRQVAENLGIEPSSARHLMQEYFLAVTHIRNFAILFLEHTLHRDSLWTDVRRRLSATHLPSNLSVVDGILFLRRPGRDNHPDDPVWYMEVFYLAAAAQAALSVSLRNFIRIRLSEIAGKSFKSGRVMKKFLDILSVEHFTGEIISEMHETGLLEKIIPEFKPLILKVEYDTYHEYPVDEHTLLMLKKLDHIDQADPFIRDIFYAIEDRSLLKLAFLLHDIGKGMQGSHAYNGAVISENICDRLGLNDSQKELIRFLILHHLEFSTIAFSFEIETNLLMSFAGQVINRRNLDYLFLLTVFDIQCVSYNALTGWKMKLLRELYEETGRIFSREHFAGFEDDFKTLRSRIKQEGEIYFEHDKFEGFERLTVVSYDRKSFLADLVACVTSEGYDILNTKVYTFPDSTIVDILHIQPDESTTTSPEKRLKNIEYKWGQLCTWQASAEELIKRRLLCYPPKKTRPAESRQATTVIIDNEISPDYSVIQITTPDQFGLLYRITRCLSELGLNIVSAKLTTKIDMAVDTFYVFNNLNDKITDNREAIILALKNELQKHE